tara:strand:- start:161 stop:1039 length:879 start_codon:yes stop_codon:yes gene_type:complete
MISSAIRDWLQQEAGISIDLSTTRSASGGNIHDTSLVEAKDGSLIFIKINHRHHIPLFEAEQKCLHWIRETKTIRAPKPLAVGTIGDHAALAMEGLQLSSRADADCQAQLGRKLAELHSVSSPDGQFGASIDNFIGATPQPNPWEESWADFFVEHRLTYQLQLAEARCRKFANSSVLLKAVHRYLSGLSISPSLLHGDLWGGNASFVPSGEPVIFDPACYFGDREADIAFSRMFGGFGEEFYRAYRESSPEPEPARESIYNLYHLLNHFNLFGGTYAIQAEEMMRKILKAIA